MLSTIKVLLKTLKVLLKTIVEFTLPFVFTGIVFIIKAFHEIDNGAPGSELVITVVPSIMAIMVAIGFLVSFREKLYKT